MNATNLRKNLFQVLDGASNGDNVEFSHKGVTFRIVLASASSRLSRLVAREATTKNFSPSDSGWDADAQAAWEAAADELFGPGSPAAPASKKSK